MTRTESLYSLTFKRRGIDAHYNTIAPGTRIKAAEQYVRRKLPNEDAWVLVNAARVSDE